MITVIIKDKYVTETSLCLFVAILSKTLTAMMIVSVTLVIRLSLSLLHTELLKQEWLREIKR